MNPMQRPPRRFSNGGRSRRATRAARWRTAVVLLALAGPAAALAAGDTSGEPSSPLEGGVCPMEDARAQFRGSRAAEPIERAFAEDSALRRALPTTREAPEADLHFAQWFDVPVERSSAWQSVLVPNGAVGLTVFAEVRHPGFTVSLELRGPNGEFLLCHECEESPVVGERKRGRGSIQIPSTDRPGSAIVPGVYRFRVNAIPYATTSEEGGVPGTAADVLAAIRTNAAGEVEHRLDLNFVYLPDIPLTKDVALSTPEFAQMLALTEAELEPLGIRFGEVSHVDLDRPEFTHLASWADAGRMFASTSKQVGRPRALNVYCVGVFVDEFQNVAGLSGGIPGAAVNGTRDSGIALRIAPSYPSYPEAYAELLAHEIGHYLGFYHTTETNLSREDPLSDTPRCEERDLRNCPDWSFHMFPIVNGSMDAWSPSQIGIGATHPIVRSVPSPGGARVAAAGADASARLRAHPNPFVHEVSLYAPGGGARAAVDVFDVAGRRLRTLESEDGASWNWDGLDAAGRRVPAGIYFARARGGELELPPVRLVRAP